MQKKSFIQQHPQQEDKSGKPRYASTTRTNSSTNKTVEVDVNLAGADNKLLKSKKKRNKGPDHRAEQ